jgi:pyrimidine-nucleoside phosphorylase
MESIVADARDNAWVPANMCQLAHVLANSGTKLQFADNLATADVASTGGPGSLSTLLCPLHLRNLGFAVPKLGVPGRPAGGIDVLGQLRGFKVELCEAEIREVMQSCGYAHFLAGPEFSPLDAALFRFRRLKGGQNIPALAVASILAKKISSGVTYVGLDVRVAPHGNFGAGFDAARGAAKDFCVAAKEAGISAVACLTDARTPNQPYIGRGEALLALELLFQGRAEPWLTEHHDLCRLMAAHVANLDPELKVARKQLRSVFEGNIEAQGSSRDVFEEKVQEISTAPRRELVAEKEGFLVVDLEGLRAAFVEANRHDAGEARFPDRIGLILRKRPGAYVERGDQLASVRSDETTLARCGEEIGASLKVIAVPDSTPKLETIVHA